MFKGYIMLIIVKMIKLYVFFPKLKALYLNVQRSEYGLIELPLPSPLNILSSLCNFYMRLAHFAKYLSGYFPIGLFGHLRWKGGM